MIKTCCCFCFLSLFLLISFVTAQNDDAVSSDNNGAPPMGVSSIFLNAQPFPAPSAFTRRNHNSKGAQTSSLLLRAKESKAPKLPTTTQLPAPSPPSPPPTAAAPALPPIVGSIKMDIDAASIKAWPKKWWGCSGTGQQQQQDSPVATNSGGFSEDDELLISSQIENLSLKAHIAVRAELLAAAATAYPPTPTLFPPQDGESFENNESSATEQMWTKAEFKILEIFRFSDLRGKGKPFLDAYATGGRIAVSFRPSAAIVASGMTDKSSDCFSSMLSPPLQPAQPVISSQNMLKKRNIKVGLTYLLFIAITNNSLLPAANATSIPSSTSIPLVSNSDLDFQQAPTATLSSVQSTASSSPSLPMSQQLQYTMMAPPLVFHKRFRHSIYNVLCSDCTNAPLIKQLNIKFNSTSGYLSAYCHSPAHPIPTFTWTLDGQPLEEGAVTGEGLERTIVVDKIRSSRKNSKLEIYGFEEKRAHTLGCSAQNHFGHATLSQPFTIQGNKMSMLLLNDEHNKNLNGSAIGPAMADAERTSTSSIACLGDLGKSVIDWAFMNPWISVFIGLACVVLFLAISMLILKCILRARFHSVSRGSSSKCPHHRQHERSPSFNAGTIVIDSSCNGDDCLTAASAVGSGRHYMTAESKVPLLGKHHGNVSLPRRHNHHHNHLAVMVSGDSNGGVTSSGQNNAGISPGSDSADSSEHIAGGKNGPMAASSNSTASSSAGAVSVTAPSHPGNQQSGSMTPTRMPQQQQQGHSTFRTLPQQRPQGPPTAPRPAPAVLMSQSWHSAQEPQGATILINDGSNNYHLPNCNQLPNYGPPPEIPPQTYLYTLAQQNQTLVYRPQPVAPPPPPPVDSDVIVKLLPALSAASSLAEFLGHENEHIEVVPEESNEDMDQLSDSVNRIEDDDGGNIIGMDSDEEIDQKRSERREYMNNLQQATVADHEDFGNVDDEELAALPQSASYNFVASPNHVTAAGYMSSSQNTAIFRPLPVSTGQQESEEQH